MNSITRNILKRVTASLPPPASMQNYTWPEALLAYQDRLIAEKAHRSHQNRHDVLVLDEIDAEMSAIREAIREYHAEEIRLQAEDKRRRADAADSIAMRLAKRYPTSPVVLALRQNNPAMLY